MLIPLDLSQRLSFYGHNILQIPIKIDSFISYHESSVEGKLMADKVS